MDDHGLGTSDDSGARDLHVVLVRARVTSSRGHHTVVVRTLVTVVPTLCVIVEVPVERCKHWQPVES